MKVRLKPLACLALGMALITGMSSPAHADWRDHDGDRGWRGENDWHGGDRGWHGERWHRDHDWDRRVVIVHRDEPGYVYAPPVVYSPPPEPSGISLFLPFHFD